MTAAAIGPAEALMELERLHDLYLHELRDLYSAEQQLAASLPHVCEHISHPNLRRAFAIHLGETQTQTSRLEQIFEQLGEPPQGEECLGIQGILRELDSLLRKSGQPQVIDAGILAIAQRIEHYEIAAYGCARTFAHLLGEERAAALLQLSLDEERNADAQLGSLAERVINVRAR